MPGAGSFARAIAGAVMWLAIVAAAAPGSASAATSVHNAGLEKDANADSTPDCWAEMGHGDNTSSFVRTSHAHSGSWAEKLSISALTGGDRKLLTALDDGTCAPAVVPGSHYRLGGWYTGNAPTRMLVYLRSASGAWTYWTSSPTVDADSAWRPMTFTTPAIPAGTTNVAFGLRLARVGTLTTDDYTFAVASPPNTVIDSAPSDGTSTDARVAFHASEPATFECRLDGGPWVDCSSPRSYSRLSVGSHAFDVRAKSAAGMVDPSPATAGWTVEAPPPTDRTFSWGFNQADCSGGVWATSDWLDDPCANPDWYTEGIYYSEPDPTSPSGTNVLREDGSGVDSDGTWQAWLHHPLAVNGSWGSEHRVDVDVKLVRWGSPAQSICSWAGGPKIFLGRPTDEYETSTYTVELAICDGSVHIQKKAWGVDDCGKDPRAVDCGAGGTWYLLAEAHPGLPSFGAWHRFTAIKRDNPDGSVTLIGLRDGKELVRYTERPGSISLGPLRGGREGWRSNAIDWRMDDYTVTVSP
jgi:hypothetical protein